MARNDPPSSEITPEALYQSRRQFLKNAAGFTATAAALGGGLVALTGRGRPEVIEADALPSFAGDGGLADGGIAKSSKWVLDEATTSFEDITTYNNFYELGLGKGDPAENAATLKPRPWTLSIEGEVDEPKTLDIDTLLARFPVEERVHRMRCVEAWSMVIPWLGFPLADLVKWVRPTSRAKYVAFETLLDPVQLPLQNKDILPWPYVEGLRIDEATHPLALLSVGLYGKALLAQNGAPIRLVVPWKYGFKGIKSIVKMRFVERQPVTTWSRFAPDEYGFFANVNPAVDHPRWTQANERRIGELGRRPTLPFNGYADEVASLYAGMDLTRFY